MKKRKGLEYLGQDLQETKEWIAEVEHDLHEKRDLLKKFPPKEQKTLPGLEY